VNEALVKGGFAWVYPKYAKSKELYDAQDYAKMNELGIWNLPERERTPPWEWRQNN